MHIPGYIIYEYFLERDEIMYNIRNGIKNIFEGALKSFYRFPASIFSAIIISIISIIRISMNWDFQQNYSFLFDSVQLSFLFGAILSMAIVVYLEVKADRDKKSIAFGNVLGILISGISFLLLYYLSPVNSEDGLKYISNMGNARIFVSIFISSIAFIYFISNSEKIDSFSDSFFIVHRSYIVSLLYGIVIMIGISGVLSAFQALVYRGMSFKIYQYIGVLIGFLTYTIFLGYFPSFVSKEETEEIENIKEQPRFIFVLFGFILVPIMIALTIVLLIWSFRVLFSQVEVSFNQLSSIASSYIIFGIWLHIMVESHNTKIASFYKKAYPFTAILVLGFQAWALIRQIGKLGIKTAEYSFMMIWIFGAISVVLLLFYEFRKNNGYRKIAILAGIISIIWVFPIIGYEDLTFNSQIKRLESLLVEEEILIDGQIISTERELDKVKKAEITDAVDFIAELDKKNIPNWFNRDFKEEGQFKDIFGFEKTYGIYEDSNEYKGQNFKLSADVIDISDYSLTLNLDLNMSMEEGIEFQWENDNYEIIHSQTDSGVPKITLKLEGNIIIEEDLEEYLVELSSKSKESEYGFRELPLEDMSLILEDENISMILVFENIDIYEDRAEESKNYYVNLQGIYISFK